MAPQNTKHQTLVMDLSYEIEYMMNFLFLCYDNRLIYKRLVKKFFPYTQIDVVQFPEGLGGNDIIENTFKGSIYQQLRDAFRFIRNTIITEKIVKHPESHPLGAKNIFSPTDASDNSVNSRLPQSFKHSNVIPLRKIFPVLAAADHHRKPPPIYGHLMILLPARCRLLP